MCNRDRWVSISMKVLGGGITRSEMLTAQLAFLGAAQGSVAIIRISGSDATQVGPADQHTDV